MSKNLPESTRAKVRETIATMVSDIGQVPPGEPRDVLSGNRQLPVVYVVFEDESDDPDSVYPSLEAAEKDLRTFEEMKIGVNYSAHRYIPDVTHCRDCVSFKSSEPIDDCDSMVECTHEDGCRWVMPDGSDYCRNAKRK